MDVFFLFLNAIQCYVFRGAGSHRAKARAYLIRSALKVASSSSSGVVASPLDRVKVRTSLPLA